MRKRTKKYRPKAVSENPILDALYGASVLDAERKQEIMTHIYLALDLLRQGKAERHHWNTICQGANIGEALTELHIGDNLRPDFDRGHAALHQVALRMLQGASSTCRAAELEAIRECVAMFEIQLGICTNGELARAERRVQNLLSGGAVENVTQTYARLNQENP
jgi:hypothetical protein